MVAAFGMSHAAHAQSDREQALEARVAELERLVNALLSQQQHTETQIEEVKAVQAQQPAPTPAGKAPIQNITLAPAALPGTTVKLGGFIKADFMATRTGDGQLADSAVGRALYLPSQTPVGGESSSVDYDAHAKFSRFNVGIDSVTEAGNKLGAFFEVDFFGNALGNQNATNTYGTTVRHAYMYWNSWLAGQTWSNLMDLSALPEAVDFLGPTDGLLFVRQTQLRYTSGGFSVALENPETTLIGVGASDRGALPDLTMRYGWKGDWGTFGVGAILRQLRVDRTSGSDSEFAGGVTLGGKWVLSANDDLRYQFTVGEGINRYIGLAITADAALDAAGDLDSIGAMAGYVGWRHVFNSRLRSNVIYARSDYDNDAALTGLGVTKSVQSLRANIFYSPLPKIDVGAELMFGKRELESGADGDITRLQFTTKYSF
ncbi:DcaP family trimeric outer membrane transporter [Xanthomonadaceae bacterium JHOS43]|nr:DcaP family trimeric outer membrane transporter [Xanthomonadaceae bacterium JHOS43]